MDQQLQSNCNLAVEGRKLTFRFGGKKSVPILNELDISVERGVIYGLLGPSGCGKTTLLRCIVGRHKPSNGTIRLYGKNPGHPRCPIPGPGVGFMPQELALHLEMTTEETLTFFGRLYRMDQKRIRERIKFLVDLLDIPDRKKQIKHLSGGQQRRVSFAVALVHKPPLLILDEPTVGVDPLLRKSIWNHLQSLAEADGITILITTHYVEEARQAHFVGLMREGRLLAQHRPEFLIQKYSAVTLEDVFLKLCVKDSEAVAVTENEEEHELPRIDEESQEVWIPQKHRSFKEFAIPAKNGDTYSDCLLENPSMNGSVIVRGNRDPFAGFTKSNYGGRMGALLEKNYIRLKRNIGLVFFQLFIPAFQVIIFCLCIGGEPFDIPLAVVNQETDPAGKSDSFLGYISNYTVKQNRFDNLDDAVASVKRGENWGAIHIGPYFTDSMINRYLEGMNADNETVQNSTIRLYLDMTNQQIASTIYTKIMLAFLEFAEDTLDLFFWNRWLATPPVKLELPLYGDLVPNFTEFMAPGMILGIVYIMAVGISAMSIIIEKKEGMLDRTWIAGVRSWEVMFSILFTLFLTMILQVAIVLLFTFLAFSIPCRGSMGWVVVAVLLVGLEGMSYGLFISSIVNDENIAVMIAMGSFYPNLLMSGIIWPVEAMPFYLRYISKFLPFSLITHSMRSIISRGWNIEDNGIWDGYLVTLAWIFPVILLSIFCFRIKK